MPELNTTAIRKLIRTLTGASPWPKDFVWDFQIYFEESRLNHETTPMSAIPECGCAVGLAYKLDLIPEPDEEYFMQIFGLTEDQFDETCTLCGYFQEEQGQYTKVTPAMVSRKLEQLLIANHNAEILDTIDPDEWSEP